MFRFVLPILFLVPAAFPVASSAQGTPQVVTQTAIDNVPGEILAWQDTVYVSLTRQGATGQMLHRVRRSSGNAVTYQVGKTGRGVLVGMDPAAHTFLARETDSLGVNLLQKATLPYLQWIPLFAVTDLDPHVTWVPDGTGFLYQDILDDSIGTPCVFRMAMEDAKPHLFLFGGQRPLMAPSGDALAVVAADTVNPGPTHDIEQRQPVGVEDMRAGGFKFVAPLRTHVPTRGAWSPDGSRLALVGYGIDSTGASERRVYVYTRATGDSKKLVLPGDRDRPDPAHAIDVASWTPDGRWVAVGRRSGSVWIVNAAASQVFELRSKEGRWGGAPLWIDATHFVIADGSPPSAGSEGLDETGKYWLVEVGGL